MTRYNFHSLNKKIRLIKAYGATGRNVKAAT